MSDRWINYDCYRCGITVDITESGMSEKKRRGEVNPLCQDCKSIDRPTQSKGNQCRGWRYEVDEFDRPIHNGKLWKPGVRTCGKSDCIRQTHIIPEMPQKEAVSDSEPVKAIERVIAPKPKAKPSRPLKVKPLPEPIEGDFLDQLEAERYDQTYRGKPKLTLNQLQAAVELERYR